MTPQNRFAQALRVARVLWGSLTASTVIFAGLALGVPHNVPRPMELQVQWALVFLALVVAIVSFVLPARTYSNALQSRKAEVAQPEPMAGFVAGQGARFVHPGKAAGQAVVLWQTPFILSMALSEAVTLLGFIIAWSGGALAVAGPLMAAGTLLAAVRFPTLARMLGPYERAHGATFGASSPPSY
jgi:hypothetical protein